MAHMKPAVLLTLLRGVERLAEALLEVGDVELVTLYDATLPHLRDRGLPFMRFKDFVSEAQDRAAREEAHGRAAAVMSALNSAPDCAPEDRALLRGILAETLEASLAEEIILTEGLRRCARELDLRAIVVHQDICRDTKTLVLTGKRLGIPSFHLLHGFPNGSVNSIHLREPSASEVVAVYSDWLKRIYESFGFPPHSLIVTGNPEWDVYAGPLTPAQRRQACHSLDLDPARTTVTYALTYIDRLNPLCLIHKRYVEKTTEAVVETFAALGSKHPDWQFVLRPHPNDPDAPRQLEALASQAGLRNWRIDTITKSTGCVAMTDAMVCTHSNMGIEAILAGKPVVNVVLKEWCNGVFDAGMGPLFLDDDAVRTVGTTGEIAPAIEAALLDENEQSRFLRLRPGSVTRFNGPNDGRAAERVAQAVLDLAAKGAMAVRPLDRYPDFEPHLAALIPEESSRVCVVGTASIHVLEAIMAHAGHIPTTACPMGTAIKQNETLVLSDPLNDARLGRETLAAATAVLAEGSQLIFAATNADTGEGRETHLRQAWAPAHDGFEPPTDCGAFTAATLEARLRELGLRVLHVRELVSPTGTGPFWRDTDALRHTGDALAWVVRTGR